MRPADLNSQGSSINHLVWNWSQFFASQSTTATQIGWTGLKDSSNKSSVKTSHPKFGMQMGKTWQKYNARRRLDNILQHHKKSSNQIRHGSWRQIQGLWRKRQRLCGKDETFLGHFEIKLGKDIFRIDTLFQMGLWVKFCQNWIFGL